MAWLISCSLESNSAICLVFVRRQMNLACFHIFLAAWQILDLDSQPISAFSHAQVLAYSSNSASSSNSLRLLLKIETHQHSNGQAHFHFLDPLQCAQMPAKNILIIQFVLINNFRGTIVKRIQSMLDWLTNSYFHSQACCDDCVELFLLMQLSVSGTGIVSKP